MTTSRSVFALLVMSLFTIDARPQPAVGAKPGAKSDSLTIAYPQYLWPKAAGTGIPTVYYVIDAASDPNATPKITAAIKTFNGDFSNVIQWVQWNSSLGANYVDINLSADDLSGECEANEGYEAIPAQPMSGSTNCTIGTILHEMGHVIGLWHEQSRSDRASYVTVSYANAIKGSWGNFEILTDNEQILAPYDYASVMQYIPYAFSANGLAVIETIPAGMPMSGYEGVPAQAGAPGTPALPVFDYSAGDKETIMRLYGAAPTNVTVTSNPVGLSVIVDGVTVPTPQIYAWPLYSTHTLNVPSDVQMLGGYILNSNPAVAADFYYTYGRWNNSASQSQTITVTPGTGSTVFPTTAPQISTYSANFIQLVPYTTPVIAPKSAAGSARISPQPQTYPGSADLFLVARQKATLTATAKGSYNFYEFNNGPYWLPGGLGANPKTFDVPDTGNPVDPTVVFTTLPVYSVNITPETYSSGLYFIADGGFYYSPKNFAAIEGYDTTWTSGSMHNLSLPALEYPYSSNSRYSFSSWTSNVGSGGAVTLPATNATYTATVVPQYQPATNFDYPPCGGTATLTPPSSTGDGFYPTGQVLTYTATPNPDAAWVFGGWSNDLNGLTNPANLTANGETLVFANFNTVDSPLTLTSIKPAAAKAGGKGFELTLTGTGFAPGSHVSANGEYRTVTYVSPTKLTVELTATDIASPGAFQVFVENFPPSWDGCAVFGFQTFLVEGKGAPVAEPVFSPKAGHYTGSQTVTISDAVAGATIYYTTDGTTPNDTSPVYSSPITVSATETLKANATATGYVRSIVASGKYTITQ